MLTKWKQSYLTKNKRTCRVHLLRDESVNIYRVNEYLKKKLLLEIYTEKWEDKRKL